MKRITVSQTLHNLRKDFERLWAPVVLSLVLLGAWAHMDRLRSDMTPGLAEGWMNLLLPLVWAFLAALAVQEEGLSDDREFWITRPFRRLPLAAEKGLFLLLAIHVPLFVAHCAILVGRGFHVADAMPQLLWKQLLIACCVTLPAAALAAAVANIPQFLLGLMLAAVTVAVMSGVLDTLRWPLMPPDEVRNEFAVAPIVAGAAMMVAIQYARRRTRLSRGIGAGAVVAAVLIFALVPREVTAVVGYGNPGITVRQRPGPPDPPERRRQYGPLPNGVVVGIPLEISGLPARSDIGFEQLSFEMTTSDGERFRASPMMPFMSRENAMVRATFGGEQVLWIHNSVWTRLRTARVNIKGHVLATIRRHGEETWLPVEGTGGVKGIGRCYSLFYEERIDQSGLKVVCESANRAPIRTAIRIWDPVSGRDWRSGFRSGYTFLANVYPKTTWLSPLWREQAYFQVRSEESRSAGDRWWITREALGRAKIEVTPVFDAGGADLHYELRDIRLSEYVLQPPH